MNTPERNARDPFAPVTRIELEAALATALEPIRGELATLRSDVSSLQIHGATKADVEAMGRRIVMWMAGMLAVLVAVMGWLVKQS
ncbi:MAG: hypothetical protein ACREM1_04010 [Longimicrobiales bacterium]